MIDIGITEETIASARAALKARKPKRGRPSYISPFETFLTVIFATVVNNGGWLTLDRKNQSGTLVQFVKKAARHLPGGLIPRVLPYRLMETVQAKSAKWTEPKISVYQFERSTSQ
jgi:hypothetical protein